MVVEGSWMVLAFVSDEPSRDLAPARLDRDKNDVSDAAPGR